MEFGDILSLILEVTNTSISELAKNLSYDRSYISKWVNNKELPGISSWEDVKKDILASLKDKVSRLEIEKLAIQIPLIKQGGLGENDLDTIAYILSYAYDQSLSRQEFSQASEAEIVKMLEREKDVREYIINALTQEIHKVDESGLIYFTGNIIRVFDDETMESFHMSLGTSQYVRIKFSTKAFEKVKDKKQERLALVHKYFRLISMLSYLRFELYDVNIHEGDMGLMLSENFFYGWGFDLVDDMPTTVFITENKEAIDKNLAILEEEFSEDRVVFRVNEDYEAYLAKLDGTRSKKQAYIYPGPLYLHGTQGNDRANAGSRLY